MKKVKSTKTLEDKLWSVFSLYIRTKDSKNGANRCYTCGTWEGIKNLDAGHYIKRQYNATKYDERNVKPQCRKCNRFMGGNQDEFAIKLQKDYGEGVLDNLNKLKWSYKKFGIDELEELIDYYKEQLKIINGEDTHYTNTSTHQCVRYGEKIIYNCY